MMVYNLLVLAAIVLAEGADNNTSQTPCGEHTCEQHEVCMPLPSPNCTTNCTLQLTCIVRSDRSLFSWCSTNEEFRVCGRCEESCDNLEPLCLGICSNYLKCQCKSGYVRDAKKACIHKSKCPKDYNSCPYNEEYTDCSSCEPTCKDQNPTYCSKNCGYKGKECRCKRGYYRNQQKQCVRKNQCPYVPPEPTCPYNEVYQDCSACEPTCENQNPTYCSNNCGYKGKECRCKSGFYRNQQKQCVYKNKCPYVPTEPTCPYNEVYQDCSACEPTCENQNPTYCSNNCGYKGKECRCKAGFYRNQQKQCVYKNKCPYVPPQDGCSTKYCPTGQKCVEDPCYNPPCYSTAKCVQVCGDNEHWEACGGCEGTCTQQYPTCSSYCRTGKCICNPDYVRYNGQCIKTYACPYSGRRK